MNFYVRSNIVNILMPIVLAAGVSFAFQCGKYLFFDYPNEMMRLLQGVTTEQGLAISGLTYRANFMKAEQLVHSHSDRRLKTLREFTLSMPLGRDRNEMLSIHTKARELAQEANQDDGILLAYDPDGKYITKAEHDAAVGLPATEFAVWKTLYRCSKSHLTLSEANGCNDDIFNTMADLTRAVFLFTSESDSYNFTESKLGINENRKQFEAKKDELRSWMIDSIAGFTISLTALWYLIGASINLSVVPPRDEQAELRTDHNSATGRLTYQKSKARNNPISCGSTVHRSGRYKSRT